MAQKHSFDPFYISTLVVKMINNELSIAEQDELNEWIAADPRNNLIMEKLIDKNLWGKEIAEMNDIDSEAALEKVLQKIKAEATDEPDRNKWWFYLSKFAAAAVILVAIGSIFYFLNPVAVDQQKTQTKIQQKTIHQDNEVMLTLADGSQVKANSVSHGSPLRQGMAVLTDKNGALSYTVRETTRSGKTGSKMEVAYNTLSVPKGKQYRVTLPDGTEVWLNSQSSLTYPVFFNGEERLVELSGEGYFEVRHLKNKPFKVKSNTQVVEVLGTHFNIEAYPDDQQTTTTLAEGSVKIHDGKSSAQLKPGQMVVNSTQRPQLKIKTADVDGALAWKNGMFSFSDDRLEDIMRKVSRSYDVDIEFQGDIKDKRFWGRFPRKKGLVNLLKNLEQTKTVHFKIVGRRIIAMP